jgi:curved DNA-binding protein CbpA
MTNQRSTNDKGQTLDYYALLGVSRDASLDEIEGRYRELTEHMASGAVPPTLRDWANRETALLDEAFAVLSDPDRRARLADPPAAVTSEAGSLDSPGQPVQGTAPEQARQGRQTAWGTGSWSEKPDGHRAFQRVSRGPA